MLRSTPALALALALGSGLARAEERILLAGDSFSALTYAYGSLPKALELFGHGAVEVVGAATAIGGSTAATWNSPEFLQLLSAELDAHPTVDVVQLSLGANDLSLAWTTALTAEQSTLLFDTIAADVDAVVGHLLAQRPDLSVVLLGYDYPNFVELAPVGTAPHSYWTAIGSPTPLQLNLAYAELEARKRDLALAHPRVEYQQNLGLMQVVYGYPSLGVPPLAVPLPGVAPGYGPFPGGAPAFPSPPESLDDAVHLSATGYDWMALWGVLTFYDGYFDGTP